MNIDHDFKDYVQASNKNTSLLNRMRSCVNTFFTVITRRLLSSLDK